MRRKYLVTCLLLLALLALSFQSPTTDRFADETSGLLELGDEVHLKPAEEDENSYPVFVMSWNPRRRAVRFANASHVAAINLTRSTPLRAFLIADDKEQSVEKDSDESFTIPTTHRTTTTIIRRAPPPNPEHFMAFRDCLTKRCRPTDRGYAMVLREMQFAINEEICHARDIEFSANRIAQCDAATLQIKMELSREWDRCYDRYTNVTSVPELCRTIKYCYLNIPLHYPDECMYARRFLKYFVLAEFTEAFNGLLTTKCPEIFPTADVDAYLPNQPYR